MTKKEKVAQTRRQFLKSTALVGGSFFIVPRCAIGGEGYIAPSDKLNIAAIGAGGKGFSDIRNAWNLSLIHI